MAFDAFLVPHDRGTDRRWRRLSVPERWCAVFGVEALASKAPERGCLLIAGGLPAEAEDFAELAGVTVAVARSTIKKMRDLDLVVTLDDGTEVIADWIDRQREPRRKPSDSREAWAARKAAQRERERLAVEAAEAEALVTPSGHADVTRDVARDMSRGHADEEKGREGKVPTDVGTSPGKPADQPEFSDDVIRLCELHSTLVRQRTEEPEQSRRHLPTKAWHVEMDRLIRIDGRTPEKIERAIRWVHADPFWSKNILSVPKLRERYGQLVAAATRHAAPRTERQGRDEARRARAAAAGLTRLMQPTDDDIIEGSVVDDAA